MDEQEFKKRSDEALESLYRKLVVASDRFGFEPDFNSGALAIEFEEPKAKFVVSPNAPVRQIWVSAQSRSFKLDWNAARSAFVLPATGDAPEQTLEQMIAAAAGRHLGEEITL